MTSATRRILAALLEAAPDGELHGYKLSELTGVKAGSLYPALRRLFDARIVEDRIEQLGDTGRHRRYYKLTGDGVLLARELQARPAGAGWRAFLPEGI